MIQCLVTSRRRLCPGAASFDDERRAILEQARRAVEDRIDFIQLREPDLGAAVLAALAADLVSTARGSATRIVVNDRLDVALASGAHGVHLRTNSLPAHAVRTIAPPPFIVGRSVHTIAEAQDAGAVDYLIAGTVFTTPSKRDADRLLGVDGLRSIVAASRVPVLAIGGVRADNLSAIASTGAAGFAAIGLFIDTLRPRS